VIAANLVRDHWRKAGRERRAITAMTAAARPDPGYQPVQDVDVLALIQTLPASMRSAFLLHYYAGFALREVAVLLGRPDGTVKADLSQARARLRSAAGPAGRLRADQEASPAAQGHHGRRVRRRRRGPRAARRHRARLPSRPALPAHWPRRLLPLRVRHRHGHSVRRNASRCSE
jgi:hypothetical protein